jgi:hypothetical protein
MAELDIAALVGELLNDDVATGPDVIVQLYHFPMRDVLAAWPIEARPQHQAVINPAPTMEVHLLAWAGLGNLLFHVLRNHVSATWETDAQMRHVLHWLALGGHAAILARLVGLLPANQRAAVHMWDRMRNGYSVWAIGIRLHFATMGLLAASVITRDDWADPVRGRVLLQVMCSCPGERPFHYVCRQNYLAIRQGRRVPFDLNQVGFQSLLPISAIAFHGRWWRLRPAILAGADLDWPVNSSGRTPLHNAVTGGDLSAIAAFIYLGANPNVRDRAGYTPLMTAFRVAAQPEVETLLVMGANPRMPDVRRLARSLLGRPQDFRYACAQMIWHAPWPIDVHPVVPFVPDLPPLYDFTQMDDDELSVVYFPSDELYPPVYDQPQLRRNPVRAVRLRPYGP